MAVNDTSTNDYKREREEREKEKEAGRDWRAHGDSMDLLIEGVTVDKVGHIDCGKHLASWQYHTSSVN